MSFSFIEGQERAVGYLKQSLEKDKLHHAYLFSGPEGVGKKKTAVELVKALNCQRPTDEGGCDQCPSCSWIDRGTHPDFIHLQPEGNFIRIEQIRELTNQLMYGPVLGRSRLCLLDMASDLNDQAANAFLKTLEEPPANTFFVLLVRDPGELLPTIVSRCVVLPFHPLPLSLVEKKLITEKGLAPEEARALSLVSDGSLGKALQYHTGDFRKKQEKWFGQLAGLAEAGIKRLFTWAGEWAGSREESQENLEIGQWCLRDLIWIRAGLEDKTAVPASLRERIKALAFSQPERVWLRNLVLLNRTAADLRRNVNIQLNWEVLFLKMAGKG